MGERRRLRCDGGHGRDRSNEAIVQMHVLPPERQGIHVSFERFRRQRARIILLGLCGTRILDALFAVFERTRSKVQMRSGITFLLLLITHTSKKP